MNTRSAVAIMVAALLVSAPALGQSLQNLRKTGENLADISERDQLLITGSTTMEKYTVAVGERVTKLKGRKPPILRSEGSTSGIKAFCAGIGAEYPDIVASTRRMRKNEFEACLDNLILDIIELKIGYSALVVVTKKGNPVFDIVPRMMYLGLADRVPAGESLGENTSETWADVDIRSKVNRPDFGGPHLKMKVYGPDEVSGSRGVWDDMMMQAGCRHIKQVRRIFDARARVTVCTSMRDGDYYIGVPEPYYINAVKAMMDDPEPSLAIVPFDHYAANRDTLDVLTIEGVEPSTDSISDDEYHIASPLYYYVKRAHMRNKDGVGVVRGLREFIGEMMRETTIGPGGYLVELGLTPLPEWQREEERYEAAHLKRFSK